MGLFSFLRKPKQPFTPIQMEQIVDAIRNAEKQTSGEVRVYVESRNPMVKVLDRAAEIFYKLKMQETDDRNAVLLYLAIKDHEVALFADEGIYKRAGGVYWENEMSEMLSHFKTDDVTGGITNCLNHIGATLKKEFPYDPGTDRNELPDSIVFGK